MDLNVNLEETVKFECYNKESPLEGLRTQTLPHRYGVLLQSLIRGALCSGSKQDDKRPIIEITTKRPTLY